MSGNTVNCTWNCLVGKLMRREVDIVVADLTISAGRTYSIDFVYPSYKGDTVDIIYRRGPPSVGGLFQLVKPLHKFVYITFISACLVTLVLYRLLENIILHIKSQDVERRTIHFMLDVPKYGWDFAGSLFKQGFQRLPMTYSGKVLLSFWWLLVLMITSAYSANLIAALSSPPREFTLSSIDELTDSHYTVGMLPYGISYDDMKTSKRPNIQRLFNKMWSLSRDDSGIFLYDKQMAMARVRQGGHAFLIYKNSAEMLMARDCQLSVIGETVTRVSEQLSFGLPKDSPLKSELDRTMRVLQESGILDKLWKKYVRAVYTQISRCSVDRNRKAMSLKEVGGGFLIVPGGVTLSLVVLIAEIWWTRFWNYH